MKNNKFVKVMVSAIEKIFGYGILISLFMGGLSFVGYLAALIIGGAAAEAICIFIYKSLYPKLVYISTISIMLGLVKMYLTGETELTIKADE